MADPDRLSTLRKVHQAGEGGGSEASRKARRTGAKEQALEHELNKERAGALGRAGRKLEAAVAAVRQAEAQLDDSDEAWERYLAAYRAAVQAQWEMRVHREAVGLRDHRGLYATWPLPPKRQRG